MTKKVAVINDLSGFGRCSLTAAISVLAAMGVSPCPYPTAVLSGQTGYPSFFCDDYTDRMEAIRQEWETMQVSFQGIYTGYIASESQFYHIFRFLESFRTSDTFLLVDPVMGDNGQPYKMYTPELCRQMKQLALQADYVTPNLTEFCLLTDSDYSAFSSITDPQILQDSLRAAAAPFWENGSRAFIITGIPISDSNGAFSQIGNLYLAPTQGELSAFPYIGGSFSGTGDLFASVLTGGIARGDSPAALIRLAGKFIECAMQDSVKHHVPRNDGTDYEPHLWMLTPQAFKKDEYL